MQKPTSPSELPCQRSLQSGYASQQQFKAVVAETYIKKYKDPVQVFVPSSNPVAINSDSEEPQPEALLLLGGYFAIDAVYGSTRSLVSSVQPR